MGSSCTVVFAVLRWKYWNSAFAWLNSPLVLWSLATFVLVDASYGVTFAYVRRYERRSTSRVDPAVKSK